MLDGWSQKYMKGFVTLTAHHISKTQVLENFVLRGLALEVALDDENAANLLLFLMESLNNFQVSYGFPSRKSSLFCPAHSALPAFQRVFVGGGFSLTTDPPR